MKTIEEKRQHLSDLLSQEGAPKLAKQIEDKCGAVIAPSTLNRAGNNEQSSNNTLCLLHYVLTH